MEDYEEGNAGGKMKSAKTISTHYKAPQAEETVEVSKDYSLDSGTVAK